MDKILYNLWSDRNWKLWKNHSVIGSNSFWALKIAFEKCKIWAKNGLEITQEL